MKIFYLYTFTSESKKLCTVNVGNLFTKVQLKEIKNIYFTNESFVTCVAGKTKSQIDEWFDTNETYDVIFIDTYKDYDPNEDT